jgi:hypothetical protein
MTFDVGEKDGASTLRQRGIRIFDLGVVITPSGRCEKIDLAEISSEPKCMPKPRQSLISHPGAVFFKAEIGRG